MTRLLASGAGLAVALALLAPAEGLAQPRLDEARERFYAARFDDAAARFDEVLARPDLDVETAVEAHRYRAALHLLAGEEVEARRHARAAVALDPAVRAPEGVSRVEPVFEAARASLPDAPSRVSIQAGEGRQVRAVIDPYVAALFAELELRCGDTREVGSGARVSVEAPPDAIDCQARALTAGGAALLTERLTLDGTASEEDVTLYAILGGAGGAVLLGVVIAVVAAVASDDGVRFDQVSGPWP